MQNTYCDLVHSGGRARQSGGEHRNWAFAETQPACIDSGVVMCTHVVHFCCLLEAMAIINIKFEEILQLYLPPRTRNSQLGSPYPRSLPNSE